MRRDVVIVGSGPAGAASAIRLLQRGITPVIVERAAFPRYRIGESLTGECGAVLRELGFEDRMDRLAFPVKRSVKVHAPAGRSSFVVPVQKRSPSGSLEPTHTWQVRRSVFDQMLLDAAIERGAELITAAAAEPILEGERVRGVRVMRDGHSDDLSSEIVVDASGQSAFLARRGVTGPVHRGRHDKQVALFTQVAGTNPDPAISPGDTLLFQREKHHWSWFIPLSDDVISVGVVANAAHFRSQPTSDPEYLRQQLLDVHPDFTARLGRAELVEGVHSASSYSYRVDRFAGPGFLCVGDSHRFIDPIFSFGVYFGFREADFAADAIASQLGGDSARGDDPFARYERLVDAGQDVIENLIACFWDHPLAFSAFVHDRYTDEVIDAFAGRIYGEQAQSTGLVKALRKLATRASSANSPAP